MKDLILNFLIRAIFGAIFILIFILTAVFYVTKLRMLFDKENIESVEASAKTQLAIAEKMSNVSEDIVANFDVAGGYIKELSSAINVSNASMQSIATCIGLTTQSIQEQAQRCQDIQQNTQDAMEQTEKMVEASAEALKEVKESAEAMEELHSHAQSVEKNNSETVAYVKELNRVYLTHPALSVCGWRILCSQAILCSRKAAVVPTCPAVIGAGSADPCSG